VDLTGGWYDAGDHVKFGFPAAGAATLLAWGVLEFEPGYQHVGQLPYIRDNLRWIADYFVAAHTAPDELWGQVGNGTLDHAWWGPAEVMQMARPSYKIDATCPGSDLAAETAAALAAISMVFQATDPAYASDLLSHAEELYDFANTYEGKYSDCITDAAAFYNSSSGYDDELFWGAAWLYKATGDTDYLQDAHAVYPSVAARYDWTHNWDDKAYGAYVLMAQLTGDPQYEQDAENWLDYWTVGHNSQQVLYTPGGLAWLNTWGALRYAANTAFIAFIYSDYLDSVDGDAATVALYHDFAVDQLLYMLGDNPLNRSLVVGYGDNPPVEPHHRTAHGSWANHIDTPTDTRHILYGALVGGPDASDSYVDDRNDHVKNEVALDFNAGFTGALARLVQEYGGQADPLFPEPEVRDDEFFVMANISSEGGRYVTVDALIHNRSAWPARGKDQLSFRYFVDLTEVFAAGYLVTDVTISVYYDQGAVLSGLVAWDLPNDLYYIEADFSGTELYPGGEAEYRKEILFHINLPYDSSDPDWDSSNDWSYQGLPGGSPVLTEYIPIYDDGVLIFGLEP